MVTGIVAADKTVGVMPFTVNFTFTLLTGTPVSLSWDFGDGEISGGRDISHIYTSVGNNRVVLTIKDDVGDVTVLPLTPLIISVGKIAFSVSASEGQKPLLVSFSNESIAPAGLGFSGWVWNFGDDTTVLGVTGPSHIYTQDGQYNVSLVASLS